MAISNALNLTLTGIVEADGSGGFTALSLTTGSVPFSNGTTLIDDNSNFFWDDTNNRLGLGTATPLDTLHLVGNMDLVHTATESDDHALEIECDAAGFGDVKALDIDYITGAITAVQDEECILLNIDETASTGGIVNGYEVLTTTEGSAVINGYTTGVGVNPIVQESGTFGDADNILNIAVDVTAALASGGAGAISIFVADNNTFTIGDAAIWDEMEIILDTGASGAGVAPTFEYSTGGASYSAFVPADGTNGFRNTGAILWDSSTLAGWATATSGEFEIRITRTRNSLSTTPIIDELQISSTTEFKWDKNGDVNLNSLTVATPLAVPQGGIGIATATDHGFMLGSGTSALTPTAAPGDGQIPVGAASADPNLITAWMNAGNNCWYWNLSFTHSAGSLVIAGGDGTALSATNPGYIVIPSNATQGRLALHKVVANETLTVSELSDNLLGTTVDVAWGSSLPVYIGFMADSSDANLEPILTRLPHVGTSPASSANIGDPSSATGDLESSCFCFNDVTEANYQSMQQGLIGSLTITKDAGNDWTLDALTDLDGVGRWNDNRYFTQPVAQNGAVAGKYFAQDSGTAPGFSTNNLGYLLSRTGRVHLSCAFVTNNVAGVGAATLDYVMPIARNATFGTGRFNLGYYDSSGATFYDGTVNYEGDVHRCSFNVNVLVNGSFTQANSDTSDQMYWTMDYFATTTV